jgi:hypothetical protein
LSYFAPALDPRDRPLPLRLCDCHVVAALFNTVNPHRFKLPGGSAMSVKMWGVEKVRQQNVFPLASMPCQFSSLISARWSLAEQELPVGLGTALVA